MAQDTYNLLLRGYDIVIENAEDDDAYKVTVREGSGIGWDVILPVNLDDFEGDNEELDGSDALMQYLGNAAVDLYEAERDKLGEGAVLHEEASMKRRAYYDSMQWEDWFMRLKGTPFEEQAYQMLQEYLTLGTQQHESDDALSALFIEEEQIKHDLNMMNLERMKRAPSSQIIIIQGSKKACGFMSDDIEEFLARFAGDEQEAAVISKMRELLDVRDKVNRASEDNQTWKKRQELEGKMHDLALQAMQQNVKVPTGMDGAPNMAADLASLMEGIDLNAPLEMSARRTSARVEKVPVKSEEGFGAYTDEWEIRVNNDLGLTHPIIEVKDPEGWVIPITVNTYNDVGALSFHEDYDVPDEVMAEVERIVGEEYKHILPYYGEGKKIHYTPKNVSAGKKAEIEDLPVGDPDQSFHVTLASPNPEGPYEYLGGGWGMEEANAMIKGDPRAQDSFLMFKTLPSDDPEAIDALIQEVNSGRARAARKRTYAPSEGTAERDGWDRCLGIPGGERSRYVDDIMQSMDEPGGRSFAKGWLDAYDTYGEMSWAEMRAEKNPPLEVEARRAFSETETSEDRLQEKGEQREFLDPACVPVEERLKFDTNDEVSVNKKLEIAGPGWGETTTIESGTKGRIETATDAHGDCFFVRLDDGRLIRVGVDDLSKAGS